MQVGNTKYGYEALKNNAQGSNNSAFGSNALQYTDSSWNTSVGACANMMNVSGISNIAVGTNSLLSNTAGSYNTAIGTASLLNNKANSNTSVGSNSMQSNTDGAENIAIGVQAGYNNTTGSTNIFIGNYTGLENIDGSDNVFLGHNAGLSGSGSSGGPNNYSGNTFLGANSKNPNGCSNATAIGYNSEALVSNGITMGNYGQTVLIPGTGYMTNTSNLNKLATIGDVQTYVSSGIILVEPCVCATTEEITLTSYFGLIDDIIISDGDRVLVRCQNPPIGWTSNASTNSIDNGIYVYKYDSPTDASFSRVSECDAGDIVVGQSTLIRSGTLNDGTLFKQVNDPAIVGDNSLNYIALATFKFSLGNGLEFIGNELNVKSDLTGQNGSPFLTNVTMGSLIVTNDVSMNSKLNVVRDVSLNQKLSVGSDVSLNGKLNVDGSLNVVSDVSLNQKLRVGGDVSLNSKLSVSGDVSMNSKLNVVSDVSLNQKLSVGSDVSLNQKLSVGSNVSLNGKLTVSGDASFGKIDCSNNLRITCNFADASGSVLAFEPMEMINNGNGNKLSFCLNGGPGSYNKIVNSGDNIFVYNGGPGQDAALSIVPYDTLAAPAISNGLRMTETTTMLGSGGTGTLPVHRLTTDLSGVYVDGSMSVISDISINGIRVGKGRNNVSTNMFIGYLSSTPTPSTVSGGNNTSIGYDTLKSITSGVDNVAVGYNSGANITTGGYNVFMGRNSGLINNGMNNVMIGAYVSATGNQSAISAVSGSVIIGAYAGFTNKASNSCFIGYNSGYNNIDGNYNTFVGYYSGYSAVSGNSNTCIGYDSGRATKSTNNCFVGKSSGRLNVDGSCNCYLGTETGYSNANGSRNCYVGFHAGHLSSSGNDNIFVGPYAGYYVNGSSNIMIGYKSGSGSVVSSSSSGCVMIGHNCGINNFENNQCFVGFESGKSNTDGSANTFFGHQSGFSNTVGLKNTFIGYQSGYYDVSGNFNTFTGYQAGFSNKRDNNCYFGYQGGFNDASGSNNSFFGYKADVSSNLSPITNSTAIGANAKVDASNQIVLGTSTERVKIPGKMLCVGDASFSNVDVSSNLKVGTGGIRFSDNTVQVTAYTGTAQSQIITFTTTTSGYLIPSGVYKIDIRVVGRGGEAGLDDGSFRGGSGAGGQIACITNCPLQDGYSININFSPSVGATAGYVEVADAYTPTTVILRAYNGGSGGNATPTAGGAGGIASSLSSSTVPTLNSNYGSVFALAGSNGSAGGNGVLPLSIGVVKGSPPNVSANFGNGQLSRVAPNTWATGAVYITYYLK